MSLRSFSPVLALIGLMAVVMLGLAGRGAAQAGTTFTVNTTDTLDDGVCNATHCSLLDARDASDANSGKDKIAFGIPGPAPHVIALPWLIFTDPVDILGDTQAGWSVGHPVVVIDGTGNSDEVELELRGGDSTVRGLVIHGNGGFAIVLQRGGNIIEGNFIGTDVTGTSAVPTGGGILTPLIPVPGGAPNNRIGGTDPAQRNVIATSNLALLLGDSSGNIVEGNLIGTDVTGEVDLPGHGGVSISGDHNIVGGTTGVTPGGPCAGACNVISGVGVMSGDASLTVRGSDNVVQGNLIGTDVTGMKLLGTAGGAGVNLIGSRNLFGGIDPRARNVVAGCTCNYGVAFSEGDGNRVEGNLIGTDITGTRDFGNHFGGVWVRGGTGNIVGGSVPAARNVISGNGANGVFLEGGTNNTVEGNFIGTDITGTIDVGNGSNGIASGSETDLLIADNVISGNGYGATLNGSSHRLEHNLIGTNAAGTLAIPNDQDGVVWAATGVIGGPTAADRNVISGNGEDGIVALSGGPVEILNNYIGTSITGTAKLGNGRGVLVALGVRLGEPGAGNVISGNSGDGVALTGATVQANLIGTSADGGSALANGGNGIACGPLCFDSLIGGSGAGEGNLISGNSGAGISLNGSHVIQGNRIGTDVTGTIDVGNGGAGIAVGQQVTVGGTAGTTPGGPCTGACNLISGNGGDGIVAVAFNTVQGNVVGLDVTGQKPLKNDGNGVVLGQYPGAGGNTLGGTNPAARNLISANGGNGVVLNGLDNLAQGNFIGTNAAGSAKLGNTKAGVVVNGLKSQTVGGTAPGAGNVVSGNGSVGVEIVNSASNVVQGNLIGTDLTGTTDLGNAGHGVSVTNTGSCCVGGSNMIGGIDPGSGNVIRFNGGDGVLVTRMFGNAILGNSIFANTGLGIDLDDDGVTPNDPGDGDGGANFDQNFPIITGASGGTTIAGTLNSRQNQIYRVELFSNVGVKRCDPSGNGEGETLLAATQVTTDNFGSASFSVTLSTPPPAGAAITATATDPDGNTSEFSLCETPAPKGTIVVKKQTFPAASPQSFAFTASYASSGFSLSDGQSSDSGLLTPGSYSVSENPVSGWDTSASCSDGSPITNIGLSAGETVTCTFVNTQRGAAKVVKTVSGAAPSGTQSFAFELRRGASTTSAGTILESASATAGNGGVITFASKLIPGTTYALCEIVLPGWTTTLGPPFYVVFNPSGDNSTVCTDFSVQPGQTKSFSIDNKQPPGGLGRTIGFWKNWASCASSKGNQKPVLDQTLSAAGSAGITIGTLILHTSDCLKAVRLLDKSTIDKGTKMASDPAFGLAAQLLAAKLNIVAGAGSCPSAVSAINDGQTLLAAVHFNGITHDKLSATQASQANALATTLDKYNNNTLC
jgi:hypothetical protein